MVPKTDRAEGECEVTFGAFRFDPIARALLKDGIELPLPPRVLGVLECLLHHRGVVVSKQTLIDAAWKDACVSDASLAEAISSLRETLGDDPQRPAYIQTIHRRGYRFLAPAEQSAESRVLAHDATSSENGTGGREGETHASGDRLWLLPWIVSAFSLLTAAAAVWQVVQTGSRPRQAMVRLSLPLQGHDYLPAHGSAVAVSPDGNAVAYVATRDHRRQLFVRAMERLDAQPLPGTDGATAPFFSPDGGWIGFFAEGKLKKISRMGGRAVSLADTRTDFGACWTSEGSIVFSRNGGLAKVSDAGGRSELVIDPKPGTGELAYLWPEVLPGNRAVLVSVQAPGPARIAVVSLETKEKHDLITGGTYARYAPTGHVIFSRASELMAVAFDTTRLEVTSPPTPILDGVATNWYDGSAHYAFSRNGSLVYVPGTSEPASKKIAWVTPGGGQRLLPAPARPYTSLAVSPDGRRAALTVSNDIGSEVWISDLERGTLTRLTHDGSNLEPVWTPRGDRVTFASGSTGPFNLFWTSVDDNRPAERLLSSPNNQFPSSWSPDGRTLAFTEFDQSTRADIRLLSAEDDGRKSRPFIQTRWDDAGAAFSPDGRFVAYQSNDSGRWEVYLAAYPEPGKRLMVSIDGGRGALWAPDGRRLYYQSDDALMAVGLADGPDLDVSRPVPIVAAEADPGPLAVTRRGLLKITDAASRQPSRQFTVVLNWFEELERLVPQPLPKLPR